MGLFDNIVQSGIAAIKGVVGKEQKPLTGQTITSDPFTGKTGQSVGTSDPTPKFPNTTLTAAPEVADQRPLSTQATNKEAVKQGFSGLIKEQFSQIGQAAQGLDLGAISSQATDAQAAFGSFADKSKDLIKETFLQPTMAILNQGLAAVASTRIPEAAGQTIAGQEPATFGSGAVKGSSPLLFPSPVSLAQNIKQTEDPGTLKEFALGQASEDLGTIEGTAVRELPGAQFARGAGLEGTPALLAELAVDILVDPFNFIDIGVANDFVRFNKASKDALKAAGLLDEAEGTLKAAFNAADTTPQNAGTKVMEEFVRQLDESTNGRQILEVLGEQSDEAKRVANGTPTQLDIANLGDDAFTDSSVRVDDFVLGEDRKLTPDEIKKAQADSEKLRGTGQEQVQPSNRALSASTAEHRKIKGVTEGRLPVRTVTMSERQALTTRLQAIKKGSIETLKQLQDVKTTAARQIKDMIPENNITRTDIKRLVNDVANVTDVNGLQKVIDNATQIAEVAIQKQLIGDIRTTVKNSLSGSTRITPSQLRNSDELLGSRAFVVAEQEQQAIANLVDFFNLTPPGESLARKYKSAEAFLKANPNFKGLPRRVVEGVAGVNKIPINALNNDDLLAIKQTIDTLVEQGKVRTRLDTIRRARGVEQQLDEIAETATRWDAWDKESMWNIVREGDVNFMTTQTIFDILDGGIGSRTRWQRTGKVYDVVKRPVDEAAMLAHKGGQEFFQEASEVFKQLKLNKDEWHNVAVYAYSKQSGARSSLIKSGIPAEQIDRIPTEKEMAAYNYMRSKLDEIKPKLDATMQETHGATIGYVEDYFPLMRNYDVKGLDDIVSTMEAAIDGRSFQRFRRDSAFGAIKKERTGKSQSIQLHAGEIFLKYMDKAIYFNAMEPAIANARNIVANPRFGELAGEKGVDLVSSWVGRLARGGRKETINPTLDPVLKAFKKNISIAYLARFSTAAKQFTAGVLGSGYIGVPRTIDGFASLTSKKWRDFAWEHSKALQLRAGGDATLFEVSKQIDTSTGSNVRGAVDKVNQVLVKNTVEKGDALTAMAVWIGAYKRGIAKWGDEAMEQAIHYADDIVDRSQISGHFKDTSRAQNINEIYNAAMPFQTFLIGQWNVIREDIVKAGIQGDIYTKAGSAGLAVALMSVLLMEESIDYVKSNPEYRDDNLLEHWKNNLFVGALSNVPILGSAISQAVNDFEGGVFQPVAIQEGMRVLNGFVDIYNGKDGGLSDAIQGSLSLAGAPVGLGKELYQAASELIPSLGDALPSLPSLGDSQSTNLPTVNIRKPL